MLVSAFSVWAKLFASVEQRPRQGGQDALVLAVAGRPRTPVGSVLFLSGGSAGSRNFLMGFVHPNKMARVLACFQGHDGTCIVSHLETGGRWLEQLSPVQKVCESFPAFCFSDRLTSIFTRLLWWPSARKSRHGLRLRFFCRA